MVLCCQVVLSRGGYTSAIDLWSLGCIFGELLQRVAGLGAASTPQLQVAPMFAIQGKPRTPSEGYGLAVRFELMGADSSKTVDALNRDHANQLLPFESPLIVMFLGITSAVCIGKQVKGSVLGDIMQQNIPVSTGSHKAYCHALYIGLVSSNWLSAESCFTVLVLACRHAGRCLVHKQGQATAQHRRSCKPCLTSLARRTGLMWMLCSRRHGRSTCRGCRAKPLHCTGVLMSSVAWMFKLCACMHACMRVFLPVSLVCPSSHLSLYLCESCLSS